MTDKSKSSNEAESAYWPFPKNLAFSINPLRFEIKKRTKLIRIISRVNKEFQVPKSSKKVIFHAKGDSCEKCVSCVELLKKESHGEFYQWNVVKCTSGPCRNEEDDAVAAVPLPMIAIMVSKEPFPEECHSSSQQTNSSTLPSFLGAPPQKTKKARWKFQQRSTISTKSNNKWKRPEKIKAESRKGRTAKTSK